MGNVKVETDFTGLGCFLAGAVLIFCMYRCDSEEKKREHEIAMKELACSCDTDPGPKDTDSATGYMIGDQE